MDGLVKFRFVGVFGHDAGHEILNVLFYLFFHRSLCCFDWLDCVISMYGKLQK